MRKILFAFFALALPALATAQVSNPGVIKSGASVAGDIAQWTGTGTQLQGQGKTLTASVPASIRQTWNSAGVTFIGSLIDITASASAAASKPLQIKVGGTEIFAVDKTGKVYVGTGGIFDYGSGQLGIGGPGATFLYAAASTVQSSSSFSLGPFGTADVYLNRCAANILCSHNISNGLLAQDYWAFNTRTSASVYEAGIFSWQNTANVLTIGTVAAGGGTTRYMQFVIGGTLKGDFGVTNANAWTFVGNVNGSGNANFTSGSITVANNGLYSFSGRGALQAVADGLYAFTNNAGTGVTALQLGPSGTAYGRLAVTGTAGNGAWKLADNSANAPLTASTLATDGYTIAGTLPAAGVAGRRAYVTNQLTVCAAAGAALTGGGAVVCPVFDNGVAWVGD